MKLLEKILVATNFGKDSDQTVQAAVSVAKTFNSEIILLHVIPKVSGFPTAVENLKKKVREQLQGIQSDIEKADVRVTETAMLSGVPFDQIVRHADQHDANVIIMGAGEKSDDNPFRLGITAEIQPGFISRTTYSNFHDPGEFLVTMEWETADDWIKWMDHQDAKDLQWQIDSLIGEKTLFEVYKPEDF